MMFYGLVGVGSRAHGVRGCRAYRRGFAAQAFLGSEFGRLFPEIEG